MIENITLFIGVLLGLITSSLINAILNNREKKIVDTLEAINNAIERIAVVIEKTEIRIENKG